MDAQLCLSLIIITIYKYLQTHLQLHFVGEWLNDLLTCNCFLLVQIDVTSRFTCKKPIIATCSRT